jgi:nitrite reductase/ring-hydroxylating ferredoxin subunit
MLAKESNELLCRIGPGTPMGGMLRQFWVPAVRSAKVEAGGAPVRVRLFGENFVAFRGSDGRVGFLDEACPHRGVSLALAHNEDCALRCIFHGWKISVDGQVVEVPSEPAGSQLASKVRVNHYPVRDAGGVIWVWLGKGEQPAPFPNIEFTTLPEEQVLVRKGIVHCNWFGILEGFLDSAHVTALHKTWLPKDNSTSGTFPGMMGDTAPRYEIEERPYGFMANAKRAWPDGTEVNRATEYILPWATIIPSALETIHAITFVTPIDDENCIYWNIIWDTVNSIEAKSYDALAGIGTLGPDPDDIYFPHGTAEQVWGQDRELMKAGNFSGFRAIPLEDFAVQESQGALPDRSKEHLGISDVAVIRVRKLLLDMVKEYQQGKTPRSLERQLDYSNIHGKHEIILGQKTPV